MPKVDAIVILLPTCMEVARLSRGVPVQAARVPLGGSTLEASWSQSLRPLDRVLAVALQQVGVRAGSRLRFVYRSPDIVAEAMCLKLGSGDLEEPARLALAESTPFPWAEAISGVFRLRADAATGSWYLGFAERASNTELLYALAERNGYRVADLVPDRAGLLESVTRRFARSRSAGSRCLVELGAASTAILTGHDGKVTSLRCIDLGFEAFIEAVMRSQNAPTDEQLAFDAAAAIIAKIGLMPRGDIGEMSNGVVSSSMKPLMRAAMQRLVVEVRQTIRFGIPESEIMKCHVEVGGPGSSIPNLGPTLSAHTDMHVVCEPCDVDLTAAPSVHAAALLGGSNTWLLPVSEAIRRERRTLRNALIAGGALAAAMIAVEGMSVSNALTAEQRLLAGRETQVSAIRAEIDARREAGVISKDLVRLEKGVAEAAGDATPWRALFRELSWFTERYPVRLTDLSTSTVPGGASLNLKGIVMLDQDTTVDPLARFIESMQQSPLVTAVEVGTTRRLEIEGRPAKQFSLSAQVRGVRPTGNRSASVQQPGGTP